MTKTGTASDDMSRAGLLFERRSMTFPSGLLTDVERAIFDLRRSGCRVSFSSFVEVAMRELVSSGDLKPTLERHGACARRPSAGRAPKDFGS